MERSLPRRAPPQPAIDQTIDGALKSSEGGLRAAFLRFLGGYGRIIADESWLYEESRQSDAMINKLNEK